MRNFYVTLMAFVIITMIISSCGKDNSNINTGSKTTAHQITNDSLCGYLKGTMISGHTYTMNCDVYVNKGDTLYVQSGVTCNVYNNSTFYIAGTIIAEGTQANNITFTGGSTPGSWGGFQCDSAQYVSFKWAHLVNTGGPDGSGSPRRTVLMYDNNTFIFQDCWVKGHLDDGLRLQGPQVSILRNTFESGQTSTDGEAINVKNGATGDIAYNVVWSQAGSGIKCETNSTILNPQTNVNVYNNTVVNSGFRRGAGEPGRGVNVDLFAKGNFYNNIICNVYYGLQITKLADTAHIHYGNNYFYTAVDSARQYFYPASAWGVPQSSDIISTSTSDHNPMFVNLDANITNTVNLNDLHLKPGSPAIGHGNPTYNADMGAYPTNGMGNKH